MIPAPPGSGSVSTFVFLSTGVYSFFAEHLQLRSINSIYFNIITAYHYTIISCHFMSYPIFLHAWPTSQAGSVDWHALLHQMPADVFTSVTALELRSTEITLADVVF